MRESEESERERGEREREREEKGMKGGGRNIGILRCKLRYTNSCIKIIIDLKKDQIILGIDTRTIMTN